MKERVVLWENLFLGLSLALIIVALYMAFIYTPPHPVQQDMWRIFYFHVPLAWVAFLAFFVVFVASILFLWKGEGKWDVLAHSSGEVGVVFTTLVLITGSIWAKPVWGTWWTWDPRLTTSLILWLIYVAYLIVRSYAAESSRGARFAAVVGIVGFIDVPIVLLAIVLWRTIHPQPIIGGEEEIALPASVLITLFVSLVAVTLLYVHILLRRIKLANLRNDLTMLKERLGQ